MIAINRSLTAAGTALMGASLISTATIAPAQVTVPRVTDAAIQLQASVLDIFTFPAAQQAIANQVEYAALWAEALAYAGAGLAQSLAAVPQTLITATQQIFSRDPLGALTTVEDAAAAAASAILVPLVLVQVDIGQIQLAVDSALLLARPEAAVQLGAGLFGAWDTVTRAFITAGQNFVNAVLTLNPANILAAAVGGVQGVIVSFGAGGQLAVDGIVAAQDLVATALTARQPAPPAGATVPRRAAASVRTVAPAAAELGVSAHESAATGPSAVGSAARRASAVQRDTSETAADTATPSPKKAAPAGDRAARKATAS